MSEVLVDEVGVKEGKANPIRFRRYMEREDRRRQVRAKLMSLLTVAVGAGYIGWVFLARNPAHPIMSWAFLAAEGLCLLLFVTAASAVWRLRFKSPGGIESERDYSVDIFVTCCREPFEVVEKTLQAAARIAWKGRLRHYVLDDGNSEKVRLLAEKLGFVHLSRSAMGTPLEDHKAGNLNFGLQHSHGELVLSVDADQRVHPEILQVLAGYMRFLRVGFVQSAQSFLVPDQDPFFNRDSVFYGAMQFGLDHSNAAISCGSGVLYRRAALEDIGGFARWNLVEDLTTSYELHSRGWSSFYYAYPLSQGMAPDDVIGVYQQRGQWALDTMRLFFWDNPLLKKGLPWSKRIGYLAIAFSYLCAALVFPFFFMLPVWSYITGGSILDGSEYQFGLIRTVYFLFMAAALQYLFRGQGASRQFQSLAGLFPVYLRAVVRALFYPRGRKPAYRINNVTAHKPGRCSYFLTILPQVLLLVGNLVGPFLAIAFDTAAPRVIAANVFVSSLAVWALWPIVWASLGKKTWNQEENPRTVYGLAEEIVR